MTVPDSSDPKRPPAASQGGSGAPAAGGSGTDETETVDRDALHQADYGGAREPTGIPDTAATEGEQQGGVIADDAEGGGRKPVTDRDRDYDPDGDRMGS